MQFIEASDRALLIQVDRTSNVEVQKIALALFRAVRQACPAGVTSLSPGYASLIIRFDPMQTDHSTLQRIVERIPAGDPERGQSQARQHELPVVYEGPDLEYVAQTCGLTPEEVVRLHSGRPYYVYFLGFLPGFAYMGDICRELALPRRREPRHRVPAGSVAIANQNTGIYPFAAPGGWHLIGHCDVALFDQNRPEPALLAPGDTVVFRPVPHLHRSAS